MKKNKYYDNFSFISKIPNFWPSTAKIVHEFLSTELSELDLREIQRGVFPIVGHEVSTAEYGYLPTTKECRRAISYRGEKGS